MKNMTPFELTVEQNSFRLGYKLSCHLTPFSKHNCLLKQRKKLREQLTKQIEKKWPGKLSKEQKNSLLTPGVPPKIPFASVSISHCAFMGGFIIFPFPALSVGFDLEEQGRAKENTALRISNKNEIKKSPSPSVLWSAKESAYKSISQLQDHIYIKPQDHTYIKPQDHTYIKPQDHIYIGQISIFDWQYASIPRTKTKGNCHLQVYDYQFKTENKNINGKGHINIMGNIVMACAFCSLKK